MYFPKKTIQTSKCTDSVDKIRQKNNKNKPNIDLHKRVNILKTCMLSKIS